MKLKRRLYSIDKEDVGIVGTGLATSFIGGNINGKRKANRIYEEESAPIRKAADAERKEAERKILKQVEENPGKYSPKEASKLVNEKVGEINSRTKKSLEAIKEKAAKAGKSRKNKFVLAGLALTGTTLGLKKAAEKKDKKFSEKVDRDDIVIIGSGTLAAGAGGYLSGKKKTKDVATEKSREIKKGLKNDIKKVKNTINEELSSAATNLKNYDAALQGTKNGFELIGRSYENDPIYESIKARRDKALEEYSNSVIQGKEKLNKESLKLRKKAREAVKESKELAKQAGKIKAGKVAAAGLALTGATLGAKKYVEKKNRNSKNDN